MRLKRITTDKTPLRNNEERDNINRGSLGKGKDRKNSY